MASAAIETRALRKVYPAPSHQRGAKRHASNETTISAAPFGATEIVALDALDLDINEGEFFGLLGPNGAGA